MPLPWVRLDTAFPYNPKLLALLSEKEGHRAAFVYLCSLSYSGGQGTDGFISRSALPFIHGRLADAQLLVKYGFWWPADAFVTQESDDRHALRHADPGFSTGSGWLINDWTSHQETNEENQQRRKRAQALAATRWNGHQKQSDAERARVYRERKKAGQ